MEAARPWLSSPGWGSPSGPLRAMLCIWTSTAWAYSSPQSHRPPPHSHLPPHPGLPATLLPSPTIPVSPQSLSHPPSPAWLPSPGSPHRFSWLHHWDLCRVATLQGCPCLIGYLLGPLSTPGNRLLDATLLGLSVEKRGLCCWLRGLWALECPPRTWLQPARNLYWPLLLWVRSSPDA